MIHDLDKCVVEKVTKTYFWPHEYVRLPMLWRTVVAGYRYYYDGKLVRDTTVKIKW